MSLSTNINIAFNELSESKIQIYGSVNGFAVKRMTSKEKDSWQLNFSYFDNKNRLIKIETSEKDCAIRSVQDIQNRILKTINNNSDRD